MKIHMTQTRTPQTSKSMVFRLRMFYIEWEDAYEWIDCRFDYSEDRISALVPYGMNLFFVAYTKRPDGRRIITFRKANDREKKRYAKNH